MPNPLIATPREINQDKHQPDNRCGYHQDIGSKETQEDTLCIAQLQTQELTPKDAQERLTPEKIGHRLWTCHLQMHQAICDGNHKSGSTATSTVYDGAGHLITATLGDSVCFAVVYDHQGTLLSVTRLNSLIHHATVKREYYRVRAANGTINTDNRVQDTLAMTRSIGDNKPRYRTVFNNKTPISSESQIDTINLSDLPKYTQSSIVQLIACSDGFTDGNRADTSKQGQEQYLYKELLKITNPTTLLENQLAEKLVKAAQDLRTFDNVSVAIQTLRPGQAFFIGLYDGHGGTNASTYLAKNAAENFIELSTMTLAQYSQEPFSVDQEKYRYRYDTDHNQVIKQCSDTEFQALYFNDLLTEANINLLKSYDENKKSQIVTSLYNIGRHLWKEIDKSTLQSVLKINPIDANAFYNLIGIFKSLNVLDKTSLDCLLQHKNLGLWNTYFSKYSYLKPAWMNTTNIPIMLNNADSPGLISVLTSLEREKLLTNTIVQALIQHENTKPISRMLRILKENRLMTHRNVTIIAKKKNLTTALDSIIIDQPNGVISWDGPLLHKHDINMNIRHKSLSEEELLTLADFKERLTEISELAQLETYVQAIKIDADFQKINSQKTHYFFFSCTPALDVFNDLVTQQKSIINDLPQKLSGPAYQKK